ncbi:MAG TPA: beta-galactosidase family protein [Chitinophagaceae bacterium]|nr:beta-galactosidase family protein [Chitinophagaceae bacterium]
MKKIILALISTFLIANCYSQGNHSFQIKEGAFLYDGKPIQIHSGEMHFARVPKAYWRHRLEMMKAMGLNTVATYVFWNYQETAPGVWDFKSDNRNIREFIKTAQAVGLMVILRPGPYACAEWEFGGFPWWLQKVNSLEVRTNNQPFLDSCKTYFTQLARQVKDLQITHGGPIVMVQVENEFGSYVAQRKDIPFEQHKAYINAIKQQIMDAGFDVPLFTADGSWLFKEGTVAGALPTANGEDNIDNLKKAVNEYHNGKGPYMVAEFYPGWLDHWNEPFQKVATDEVVKQTEKYLKAGISFSYYMIHGGTNFGFTSGANYDDKHDIQPDITSYDYDAPITEAGWVTPKYDSLRKLFQQYVSYTIPEAPAKIPVIATPEIHLAKAVNLFDFIKNIKPVYSDTPQTFESLDQGYGYVLYQKRFKNAVKGKLMISGLRDYGIIFINGKKIATLDRSRNNYSCDVDIPANAVFQILVENMGRINYGAAIVHNLKGITGPVMINDRAVTGNWQIFRIPMTVMPALKDFHNSNIRYQPSLYTGEFTLSKTGDTFLDMRNWQKGIVFVNGHNLGRYWDTGPQQTLYLPGCWLRKGKNEIVIFEQQNDTIHDRLASLTQPVLDEPEK